MSDLLQHLFGWICGQNPGHTWSPGGELLPCCQRCTGLYVGACVAAGLHLLRHPAPTNRWLWLNGGFLLFMVPFGFHWLPQGPELRAITGVLFGFGLVAFLLLPLRRSGTGVLPVQLRGDKPDACPTTRMALWLTLLAMLVVVPWLGAQGDARAANTLTLLAALGALALFALVLANAALAGRWLIRRCVNRTARATA
jgi:uncharacterized membrane protein